MCSCLLATMCLFLLTCIDIKTTVVFYHENNPFKKGVSSKMLLNMAIFVAPQVSFCLRTASGSSQARGWEVDVAARELPHPPPTDNLGKPPQVVRRPE